VGPADTLILDSRLQNCEQINFCCFKSLSLGCFVMKAVRNQGSCMALAVGFAREIVPVTQQIS
jgi:hypothetical protein